MNGLFKNCQPDQQCPLFPGAICAVFVPFIRSQFAPDFIIHTFVYDGWNWYGLHRQTPDVFTSYHHLEYYRFYIVWNEQGRCEQLQLSLMLLLPDVACVCCGYFIIVRWPD